MPVARVALLLAAASLSACMFQRKVVAGEYCLDFDDHNYYLVACGTGAALRGRTEAGPLEGTVVKIGWDQRFIVAWRRALFKGDGDGWMILDTQAETLEGPLSDGALRQRQRESKEIGSITIQGVHEAWRMLP